MTRWGTVSAHSGQPFRRWGVPQPQQQPTDAQRTVYLPAEYPATPAARPSQPARQQGGTMAELRAIEAELAILARPQAKLFSKAECLERQTLWQLERLGKS